MRLNFEAEAKSLRPRPKGSEAKSEAEARGYEDETESVSPRQKFWPWGQFGLKALTSVRYFGHKLRLNYFDTCQRWHRMSELGTTSCTMTQRWNRVSGSRVSGSGIWGRVGSGHGSKPWPGCLTRNLVQCCENVEKGTRHSSGWKGMVLDHSCSPCSNIFGPNSQRISLRSLCQRPILVHWASQELHHGI